MREAVEDNIDEVGVYGEGHNSLVFAIVFAKLLVSSSKDGEVTAPEFCI